VQLKSVKAVFPLWRQIIWPERKADWIASAIGAVLGTFTTIVNVLHRVAHPGWLLLAGGVGMAGVAVPATAACAEQ
jgi:hypothetical protein